MSLGSTPKAPALPPPPAIENSVDTDQRKVREDQRKKAIRAFGFPSAQTSAGLGLGTSASVGSKTLLGE